MVQQHAAHVLGELATDHLTHVGWHWPDLKVAVGAVRNDQTVVRADCHTLQPVPVSLESVSSGGLLSMSDPDGSAAAREGPPRGKAASERLASQHEKPCKTSTPTASTPSSATRSPRDYEPAPPPAAKSTVAGAVCLHADGPTLNLATSTPFGGVAQPRPVNNDGPRGFDNYWLRLRSRCGHTWQHHAAVGGHQSRFECPVHARAKHSRRQPEKSAEFSFAELSPPTTAMAAIQTRRRRVVLCQPSAGT